MQRDDQARLRAEVDESAAIHVPQAAERPSGFVGKVRLFLDLVKFEHSIFALPYAYIGALYGANALGDESRWPSWWALLWITVAMVGARSFAFVVNRAVDKEIDARNPRTASRAIPAGLIKAKELWIFSALVLAAYLLAVSQLHPITWLLWPVPLVAFVVYPYTKRFTPLCHYWLGMCLGLAPIGAWTAVTGEPFAAAAYTFGLAVLFWTAGFDIIYATQDIESDRRDRIHSVPADRGVPAALIETKVLHVVTVLLLVLAGYLSGAGTPFFVGVAIAAILLAYENALVSPRDLSRVNAAFFTVNGFIAVIVFAGALTDRLLA